LYPGRLSQVAQVAQEANAVRKYDQVTTDSHTPPFDFTRTTHPLVPGVPVRRGKRVPLFIAGGIVLVSLLLIFTSAGLGMMPSLSSLGGNTRVVAHPLPLAHIVGHIFFGSSGQVQASTSQGITDEIDLDLANIPAPATGKSYYAWLFNADATEGKTFLLGTLAINHGTVHFHYAGDATHTNLLEVTNRLLITEETTTPTPDLPSLDTSTWRYVAQIPQTPNPQDTVHHFSLLSHLRHLLASDPMLGEVGLPGGLDIWLFRNTQKIFEWAGSARDDWTPAGLGILRRQSIRILDYLDGANYVQQDVPLDTPMLVDAHIARVGLLEFDVQNQEPPGYLYHIGLHLHGLATSPGATTKQKQLAIQIDTALSQVQALLGQIRQDAKQLVMMTDAQLLQPSTLSLLDAMVKQAQDMFVGQFDPSTGEIANGITQIHYAIQRLATLDVTVLKVPSTTASNPEYIGPTFTAKSV